MIRKASLANMLQHIKEEESVFNQLTPDAQSTYTAHYLATHPDTRRLWREDLIDLRRQESYSL